MAWCLVKHRDNFTFTFIQNNVKETTGWIESWGRNRSFGGLTWWSEEEEEQEEEEEEEELRKHEAHLEIGCKAPRILNTNTEWKWRDSFTLSLLYSRYPGVDLNVGLGVVARDICPSYEHLGTIYLLWNCCIILTLKMYICCCLFSRIASPLTTVVKLPSVLTN
jgi:hypothetical protein